MRDTISSMLEDFIVEGWGRITYQKAVSLSHDCSTTDSQQADLPFLLSHLAAFQELSFDDLVYAFGKYCFSKFAAQMPSHTCYLHDPKKFFLEMNRILSFHQRNDSFVHFHYIDSAPDELVMVYRSRKSFVSFIQGFIEGASQTFSGHIEYTPLEIRPGEVTGCRFQVRFTEAGLV